MRVGATAELSAASSRGSPKISNQVCALRTFPCAGPPGMIQNENITARRAVRLLRVACRRDCRCCRRLEVAAVEKVLRPKPAALVPTVPVTAAVIQRGAQVYRENCAGCHGEDGRGDTPAARALPSRPSDQTNPQYMEAFEDQDIASRVQHGGFQMPAFPQIRGEDLIAVVAFVRSLSREGVKSLEIQSIAQGQVKNFTPVTSQMLERPADGDWLMYRRTYDSWGFSPLDEITRSNVGNLELAWARVMTPGRQYITPLAHDGVLYLETPRDIIQALDARTGDLIWEYRYEAAAARAARARGEKTPEE